MSRRPLQEEVARLRAHAEQVPGLRLLARSAYRYVARHPRLHRALRPLAEVGIRWLKPSLRFAYVGGRSAGIAMSGWAGLPYAALTFFVAWYSRRNLGIGAAPTGRTVVMLAVSDMRFDPRVEREARALASSGYLVHVIWTDPQLRRGEGQAAIDWGKNISFEAIPERDGRFSSQYPGFLGRRLLSAASAHRPFAFHGHDLDTALVAMTASRRTGAYAICDFHEWYSENVTWNPLGRRYRPHSYLRKATYRWLERHAFRHASALITVCDSIAEAMAQEAGADRTMAVIRNIPNSANLSGRNYPSLKQQLGLPDDSFLLLWQGGVGPSRMIEPIVRALAHAPRCTLLIRGPETETYGPGYAEIAAGIGASDRLLLAGPVPSQDVVVAARGADAGIWTLPNLCKNFSYALPNKIFEYLAAGLPILVAHYPEARRLVETHSVGLTFDPYDPRSIAKAINELIDNPDLRRSLADRTAVARELLDADAEWRKLVDIYEGLRRGRVGDGPESSGRNSCL